ncbi:MAG: ATP-binding protein [Candidatus Thorarchaeota archaeon]
MTEKANRLIGRLEEKKILNNLYKSENAEFLAIYGRRRVGKTFLVREFFKDKGIYFEITGSVNADTEEQLKNFHTEYRALFDNEEITKPPKNWGEAFKRLKTSVLNIKKPQKIIIFLDELPWLASGKSDFLSALDYAWNRHFSLIPNLLLIVAGSAASWMINNVINNTGGLYGRLSRHLRLLPFNLFETEQYLFSKKIERLPRKQICEIYMIIGGVPKYLSYLEPGISTAQNIHNLCFKPQSPLLTEFYKLYHSLFKNAKTHLKIVRTLANKKRGLNRSELLKNTKLQNSGRTSEVLNELKESGFIMTLPETGKKMRNMRYYLSDEYSFFYLNWIEISKGSLLQGVEKDYWIKRQTSPAWRAWAAFAFENLCLKHNLQIKEALQIGGVTTTSGHWTTSTNGKKQGEIDLVIDRADDCINLCEIKFSNKEFIVTKEYAKTLIRKKELFQKKTNTRKALFTTLITPFGAIENENYSHSVEKQLSLESLFLK